MIGAPYTTVVGNLTADPDLRYTADGAAVANFTVACTPRVRDRKTGAYENGETMYIDGSVWRDYAENVAESLAKGDRVALVGHLVADTYTDRDGKRQTKVKMDVDEVAVVLRFVTAKPVKRRAADPVQDPAPRAKAPRAAKAAAPKKAARTAKPADDDAEDF